MINNAFYHFCIFVVVGNLPSFNLFISFFILFYFQNKFTTPKQNLLSPLLFSFPLYYSAFHLFYKTPSLMKPHQKQLPFLTIHISPSALHHQLHHHHNSPKNIPKQHYQHHYQDRQYHYPSNTHLQPGKIIKTHTQPRSLSNTSSHSTHSKNKHQCKIKPSTTDQMVKEEYDLDHYKHKCSQKHCTDRLHQCKYIDHYMTKIENRLNDQKTKNSLLKRRNRELTQQNHLFNEYFQVFEERYNNLRQQSKSRQHLSPKKQKNDIRQYLKERTGHCHKSHKNKKDKHSQTQSVYEYLGSRSQQEHERKNKLHSCVTRASSRYHSRENFNFPSRFDEGHSRRY